MEQNKKIYFIHNTDIFHAQLKEYRQYFVGQLSRPQILPYVDENNLEIGSSLYVVPKADIPHMHQKSSESIYLLSGQYKIMVINTKEIYELHEGDFIVVPPRTAYASKAICENTRTLFVKTGGNDKVEIEVDAQTQAWLNDI